MRSLICLLRLKHGQFTDFFSLAIILSNIVSAHFSHHTHIVLIRIDVFCLVLEIMHFWPPKLIQEGQGNALLDTM